MEFMKVLFWIITIATIQGCGLTTKQDKLATTSGEIKTGALYGVVRGLDGTTVDLSANAGKIQVLMFVSETCSVCRAETRALVQDRTTRGVPTNVSFVSVVVGSIPEDATDWKTSLNVNWAVTTDSNDPLFRSYCPQLQTPCLVLRNPILNQYITYSGEHPISEWESFTGTWVY